MPKLLPPSAAGEVRPASKAALDARIFCPSMPFSSESAPPITLIAPFSASEIRPPDMAVTA